MSRLMLVDIHPYYPPGYIDKLHEEGLDILTLEDVSKSISRYLNNEVQAGTLVLINELLRNVIQRLKGKK